MRHLLSSSDLGKSDYDEIIRRGVLFIKNGVPSRLLDGKIVAGLFFAPSTRTMIAFQSAFIRAGGGWIGASGEQGLSMGKGESWEDTIRAFSDSSDLIVIRHPDDANMESAASVSGVPILNCGGGSKEHAAAVAMLFVNLAHALKRPLEGLRVGIYGTPQINRVCKSLVPIFGLYGVELLIDDLGYFPLSSDIEERAKQNGLKGLTYAPLDSFIGDVDLLMVTRGLQKGIFPEGTFPKEKEELILKTYVPIGLPHMKKLRKDAQLFMITPRIFEIDLAVDPDPRCMHTKHQPYTEACLALSTVILGIEV